MGESETRELEIRATGGDLAAQLQIADLLLLQGQSERGRDWLRRAASAGSTEGKLALARRLVSEEPYDVLDGVKWAQAAALDGNAEAEHLLAIVTAEGLGVRQDFNAALDHLERSAERGYAPARAELAALAGDWTPSDAADWAHSRRDWKILRRSIDTAAWLRPSTPILVSAVPRIGVIERFLSPEICRWLIERARPSLVRAQTIDPKTGKAGQDDPIRTNSSFAFEVARMDMILVMLRAKISRLTQLPISGFEDPQVLNYLPGQEYKPHFDFLDTAHPGYAEAVASGGQRVATFLAYLNEGYDGGETVFPAVGWSFKGRAGDTLFFYSVTPDGAPDRRTLHAGSPPLRGEKWLLSQWIRFRLGAAGTVPSPQRTLRT
jgi:prolyl 4-hydroxylase